MKGLAQVEKVVVPLVYAEAAQAHLREVGGRGLEGFALWTGVLESNIFYVRDVIIPRQRGLRTDLGVCVTVDGDELHRINVWLFERGMTLIAQLHSHPGLAYHSDVDNAYPIITAVGGLSLVVPDFARDPFSLSRCAVYRLKPPCEWVEMAEEQVWQLIVLEG